MDAKRSTEGIQTDSTKVFLSQVNILALVEGFVFRNCTADGWSELYPPYQEACAFRNDSEPESEVQTSHFFPSFPPSNVFFHVS